MTTIRVVQYFDLTDSSGSRHLYQNYFVNETKLLNGGRFTFAPFRAQGTVSNLTGDNAMVQVLFPNIDYSLRLVEGGDGNRYSRLTMTTQWLNAAALVQKSYEERYVGIGASTSETTIELRFRSAMDSVGAQFPALTLSRDLVGPLPTNSEISLR